MTHGFSNRDWLEFIEGHHPPSDREIVMSQHIAVCFECRQKVEPVPLGGQRASRARNSNSRFSRDMRSSHSGRLPGA